MPASTIETASAAPEDGDETGGGEQGGAAPARDRVQSNVLRSMNPQAALYIFFRIFDPALFRILVKNLVEPPVQNGPGPSPAIRKFLTTPPDERRVWSETDAHDFSTGERTPRDFSWTLAFTWTGLKALGIDDDTLATFPQDFREGMAARAARLGDVGASSPERWEEWFGNRQTHGVLSIILQPKGLEPRKSPTEPPAEPSTEPAPAPPAEPSTEPATEPPAEGMAIFKDVEIVKYLQGAADAYGFEQLHKEIGIRITHPGAHGDYRIEHFGFRDGVSQPFANARLPGPGSSTGQVVPVPPPPGGGTARPGGTWEPIALGELLLGRPDEDGVRQHYPSNKLLRNDGTYMVFRKLEQDIIGFRRYLERHDKTAGRDSLLAAQMVGRWPNGTSLVRSTDFPADELPRGMVNDFRYHEEDPRGRYCPIGSHARRINPRDGNNRDEARRHRIWRRAITYGGPFLKYGAPDDGRERGLLFIALCARIDQQFEFLQTRWLNGSEFIGQAGIGRCPLTGSNSGDVQDSFAVPGRPAPYTHLPRFVTTRGGDYFFMPSIPALAAMAAGDRFEASGVQDDGNPGLSETPKLVDPEALFEFGRLELLPEGRPSWIERNGMVLVGRHELVRKVLHDGSAFPASDQDARIRRMTGGEPLMLGMSVDDDEYKLRRKIWAAAVGKYSGPSAGAIAAQAMRTVLARHAAAGRLDLVREVSLVVPLVVARSYYGVRGPEAPSGSYIASLFNKLDITQVPRDWLAALPHLPPQDVPIATLAAWAQLAFAEVFVNVPDARELSALAARTTGEFFRHLDRLVADANPADPSTLLGCLVGLDPGYYGLTPERLRVVARLLLAELTVAGAGTLVEALPSVMNFLLDHPDILAIARDAAASDEELDKVVREALRFDPVSHFLFRRCARTTELVAGQPPVQAGSMVALLLKTAVFDERAFRDPDKFSIDPDQRPQGNYLHFGDGPHHCKGADIATPILREMVRAVVGLKDLRRAAGPLGNVFDSLGRYQSLVVRFTP